MTGQSTAPPSWGKDPACWLCKMSAAVQVCIQWGLYEQPRPGGAHSLWHGVLPRVRSCADVRCAAVLQCVLLAGPATAASAAGFYGTLLQSKRWWADELEDEGVMRLALPSPVRPRIAACALGGTPRSVRVCPSGTPRSVQVCPSGNQQPAPHVSHPPCARARRVARRQPQTGRGLRPKLWLRWSEPW